MSLEEKHTGDKETETVVGDQHLSVKKALGRLESPDDVSVTKATSDNEYWIDLNRQDIFLLVEMTDGGN